MKPSLVVSGVVLAALAVAPAALAADSNSLDTSRIEQLTGAKGKLDEKAGVFKVSVPRADLKVDAAGVKMTPPLGLTSWAAFQRVGDQTAVMGDTVMTEDQVNPVMSVALENGLEVTALHNHFFWDNPKVMFMHIGGTGDEQKLASAVGKVFARIKETSGTGAGADAGHAAAPPTMAIDSGETKLDTQRIDSVFGAKGETAPNGVHKVTIAKTTKMHGHEMGSAMGVNTWAAFAGRDDRAVVDGDFAMYEDELQPVLRSLRGSGINVVAIHNHMTHETPRVVFLHYWGVGPAGDLAKGVKAALDAQGRVGSGAGAGAAKPADVTGSPHH
jgi:hypothetical protein